MFYFSLQRYNIYLTPAKDSLILCEKFRNEKIRISGHDPLHVIPVRFDGRLDGRSPTTNLPSLSPLSIGVSGSDGRLLG